MCRLVAMRKDVGESSFNESLPSLPKFSCTETQFFYATTQWLKGTTCIFANTRFCRSWPVLRWSPVPDMFIGNKRQLSTRSSELPRTAPIYHKLSTFHASGHYGDLSVCIEARLRPRRTAANSSKVTIHGVLCNGKSPPWVHEKPAQQFRFLKCSTGSFHDVPPLYGRG